MDALILAAGRASRFGLPKFLLPAGPGFILLTKVLELALQTADGQIIVVLGREGDKARRALEAWMWPENAGRVVAVNNPGYEAGLSTSLRRGVREVSSSESALILLADQPAMEVEKLLELRKAYESGGVWAVSAAENGEGKPPVVLGPEFLASVSELGGDQGAKPLLKRHPERVRLLEWGCGDWFADVDTWETYAGLARSQSWDKEEFEPVESLSGTKELEALLDMISEPEEYLETLRRGVLTLLNRGF